MPCNQALSWGSVSSGLLLWLGAPLVIGAALLIAPETFQPASIGRLPFVIAAIGDTL